jgi:uncharacterized repeat protein (TIGR01451 family)
MKTISAFLLICAPFISTAQCNLGFLQDTIYTCANAQVSFVAGVTSGGSVSETCDFNSAGLPAGWNAVGGFWPVQSCLPSIDGTDYFWTGGTGLPSIETSNYSFECGGSITFDMAYAFQADPIPCEGPDNVNEGVSVQYSLNNGASWITIAYYSPDGTVLPSNPGFGASVSGATPFTSWGTYTLQVPNIGSNMAKFRWIQENSSAASFDTWGIDNIEIIGFGCGYDINWSTGATDTNSITVSSSVDNSYIAYAYDSLGVLQCQDTCYLLMANVGGFDNAVQLITGKFIAGQNTTTFLDAYNDGCPATNGLITVELDTALTFVSSVPPPISNVGGILTYDYSNLYYSSLHSIVQFNLLTSQFAQVGDTVSIDVVMLDSVGDINTANNVKNYLFPVVASYDPNDKKVYPLGDCIPGYVLNDELLTYTVRFQNTGTGAASNVRIVDVLDPSLDPATLKVVAVSDDVYLNWTSASQVEFMFDDIDLPSESSDSVGSIGYVVFEIEQFQGLVHGTPISNDAAIYFDFNPAIITNSVLNTVSDGTHFTIGDTVEITVQTGYSWNGELLTTGGVYTQSFPRLNDCDSIGVISLTVTDEIGLNELVISELYFYPNPTSGKVMIGNINGVGQIEIYTTSGKNVWRGNYISGQELDVSTLSKGVYFVDCIVDEAVHRGRLILK